MVKQCTAFTLFFLLNIILTAQNTPASANDTALIPKDSLITKAVKDTAKLKRFQPAFLLGPSIVSVAINKKEINGAQNNVVETAVGFNIGFAMKINFSKRLFLLPQATLNFQGSTLNYNATTGKFDAQAEFKPLTLDIPVQLFWKLNQSRWFSPAMFVGARYVGDISKSKESIGIRAGDVALEAGAGFEIRIWKITIMPRIGATIGLTNLLNGNEAGGLYESIRRQKFELSFLVF